jgi:sulfite reductase (NADPH) hemoprotein beta-component
MYKENILDTEIMSILDELIGRWSKERLDGEAFGDFVIRANIIAPVIDSARDFYA